MIRRGSWCAVLICVLAHGATACAPRTSSAHSPPARLPLPETLPTPELPLEEPAPPEAEPPPASDPQDCSRAERLLRHSMRLRDPGERSHVLERAESLCPEDADVLVALGRAYRDDGEAELASALARRALVLEPDHANAAQLLQSLSR